MKLKRYVWIAVCLIALVATVLPVYAQHHAPRHAGFQVSTLGALSAGIYEGAATLAELKQRGDFGLGTFDGLDGEMVVLDGQVYQIDGEGVARLAREELTTPFSSITFFQKERSLRLSGTFTYPELQSQMNAQLPTDNLPYAIRMEGVFPYLKVRSVPRQSQPYPLLSEVTNRYQRIFELRNVRGTLVGFRLPQFLGAVNIAGYHFHFISSDRTAGGHLLDGAFLNPMADIQTLHDWQIMFPDHDAFAQAVLE